MSALHLFVLLLSFYLTRRFLVRRRQDTRLLPGPSTKIASWIWGHELEVFHGEAAEVYSRWMYIYGPLFKIKAALFHSDIIVAGDHAAVQHIFADSINYVKSPAFRPPIANLLGKGLVWAEGEDHAHQRRLLSPAFTPESVKGMADVISECAEKLESRLTNLALSNGGEATLNIVPYMSSCTLDIIGLVAFGHDFQSSSSPSPPPSPSPSSPSSTSAHNSDAEDIHASWHTHVNTGLTFGAFLAPLVLRAVPLITSLPVKAIQAQGEIKGIVGRIARRLVEQGGVNRRGGNILSVLMRAQAMEKGSGGGGLTTSQIIDNISTFTMVGHETTAGTLNFTLLELARNPSVQQKLRDEVVRRGRDLAYDDVQKLEYLDAVVKEGLRLHPASPQTERVALKDDVLPLHTPIKTPDGKALTSLCIKKGQVFHIPFTAIQTNPRVWGPDAAEFKPERWMGEGGEGGSGLPPPNELPHGWSNLVAFCDGPRSCIGYRLAVFEAKVILATLVRALEFRATDAVVRRKISPTLQPVTDGKGGVLPLHISLAMQT
ncbi:cytochrome P450 [Rickenella mellea]|uniref:Cytochrome P450 n=1 Tax=Rickenella mellea TaxID=50990 RepID=A0A4Y7QCN8_9AGAM|nr:cytochrome P450 [Rickenella mellea]